MLEQRATRFALGSLIVSLGVVAYSEVVDAEV
jgi:hypothetical protein